VLENPEYIPPKYPRTPHLPFSPEIHKDDRVTTALDNFIGKYVVITEKLDGSNCCIYNGKVYGRSHEVETDHPSYAPIKAFVSGFGYKDSSWVLYGENMFAVHSIEYKHIKSLMYLFAVLIPSKNEIMAYDTMNEFYDFENEIPDYHYRNLDISYPLNITVVPSLFRGVFWDTASIKKWMDEAIKKESFCGGPCEGFVIRNAESFSFNDFELNVAKYVRRGHVQDEEHWSRNWKKANIVYGRQSEE